MSYRRYSRYSNDPKIMNARFNSVCPETGKQIKKGEKMVYFPSAKKAYHIDSRSAREWSSQHQVDNFGLADAGW
jgi:hypothetical protein